MADPTQQEVKAALDEMKQAFEQHKKTNDERLAAIKAGRSTAEFDEKLTKLSADLDKGEKVQQEYLRSQKASEERVKMLEAKLNRMELGAGGVSADDRKAERKAYDSFIRRGVERLSADELKVLVVSQDPTGGYLAPPEFLAEIIKSEVLYTPVRDLVTVRQVGSQEFQQPKRTQTAAATRVGEVSARTETQNPNWGMVKIPSPEMYAEGRISQQNLEDSAFSLEQILAEEFGEQFGVKLGAEFVSGTGTNALLGILDANAAGPATPIAHTVSGTAATIAGAAGSEGNGLVNLMHAVKTPYAKNGKWLLNRATLGKVRLLKDSQGRYLWEPGIATAAPASILGAPYVECPDMPDEAAGAFPIAFGDFRRAYTVVERMGISIVRDPLTLANVGQVKFTARARIGGQVVLGEAIRLLKCSA